MLFVVVPEQVRAQFPDGARGLFGGLFRVTRAARDGAA
jgi:hypothetical protein